MLGLAENYKGKTTDPEKNMDRDDILWKERSLSLRKQREQRILYHKELHRTTNWFSLGNLEANLP